MARFCTNCGRELQEGESCDCQNRMIREERETDAGAKGAEQRSGQRDNYRQGVYRQGGYERGIAGKVSRPTLTAKDQGSKMSISREVTDREITHREAIVRSRIHRESTIRSYIGGK